MGKRLRSFGLPLAVLAASLILLIPSACNKAGVPATSVPSEENQATANQAAPPTTKAAPPPRTSGAIPTAPQHSGAAKPPVQSDDDMLEQSLSRLKKGNLVYNTPEKMKTGSTAHVIARIGSDQVAIDTLKSGLPADQGTKTEIAATPVSTRMKMTLASADFDITPLSSEEQFVAGDTPTTWEWDIVPKHAGKLRLHLAAIVEVNNLSRDFTTVDRDIAVQVDPINEAQKFAAENWHWILTTLGAGIAALWTWWKKRRKQPASTEAS